MSKREAPLKCDVCGRFIKLDDIRDGLAVRRLLEPDSDRGRETWETLCKEHWYA